MLTRRLLRRLADRALVAEFGSSTQQAGHRTFSMLTTHLHRTTRRPSPSPSTSASPFTRHSSSSSSSSRWKGRATRDPYARSAKVAGLKSRAAFKLLQLSTKHSLFHRGATVVDLGYAPGSWSQVAATLTRPGGRVLGIDIIPALPPAGVSTMQGNFLAPEVRAAARKYLLDPERGRARAGSGVVSVADVGAESEEVEEGMGEESASILEMQRRASAEAVEELSQAVRGLQMDGTKDDDDGGASLSRRQRDEKEGRVADVVLSDMCEPWEQTSGFFKNTFSDPYRRMMNTSGAPFRDHAGSMDLCDAALTFAFDTLRTGGHFVCKFYQGAEDKALELRLKRLFEKVHREKPDSSRKESKENFFVALRRKEGVERETIWGA